MRRKIVITLVVFILSLAIYLPGNFTLSQGEKNAGAGGAIYWKGNKYSNQKLKNLGWNISVKFEDGLSDLIYIK